MKYLNNNLKILQWILLFLGYGNKKRKIQINQKMKLKQK